MPRKKVWLRRALAVCFGLGLGLVIAECGLRVLGLPHFYKAHTSPPQFVFLKDAESGKIFYVNEPSTGIAFQYGSNPRGYFEPGNLVVQHTNNGGFRGPPLLYAKPPRTVRLVFLGDSFTFGEGVRDEDTFAAATGRLLAQRFADKKVAFQSYNLGVGGYNTADELFILKKIGLSCHPDAVVLCYNLNDAEPSLFKIDAAGKPVRRDREKAVPEGVDEQSPPQTWLFRSRVCQVAWRFFAARRQSRQTEDYYRGLYAPSAEGWKATRDALRQIAAACKEREVPLVVVLFPLLHRLDSGHPFRDLYTLVGKEAAADGGQVLNLFPAFEGKSAERLWVYPTDQHPNEAAHRIAAEQIADDLESSRPFLAKIEAAAKEPVSRLPNR